ncbi:MAG: hypothetical protein HYT12_01595 [Candidatus Liptonbacteria bacterium]|nr:hypothetical protein [Candidatus Liptonbacteria bacterium]
MTQSGALPSQQFVEVEEIKEDTVVLKAGGLRKILLVSGINTELKSEEEQSAVYFLFQNFLNSLDFSIQIAIHSRKLNISEYLEYLKGQEENETNELLKNGIEEYAEFIKSFVQENDIMTKNFFVVVPFESLAIPGEKKIKSMLPFGLGKSTNADTGEEEEDDFTQSVNQLNQRVDQVIAGLHNVGLRAVVLNTEELTELFYNLYNPETIEKKMAL